MTSLGRPFSSLVRDKNALLVALAIVLLAVGWLGLEEFKSPFYIYVNCSIRHLEQRDSTLTRLSVKERNRQYDWETAAVPARDDLNVYYRERRHGPWTRWLPLIKFGKTRITRQFFVVRGDDRIFSGVVKWEIDQVMIGLVSAREYSAKASGALSEEFVKSVQEGLSDRKSET